MRKRTCKERGEKLGHLLMALPGILLEMILFGSTDAAKDGDLRPDPPSSGSARP